MSRAVTILEQELGTRAAIAVMEIAGGERLHVAGTMKYSHRLRARFGDPLAELLIERMGNSRFYVPRMVPSGPVDDEAVASLDAEQQSATQIARLIGCSVRAVHKSRARNRASRYVSGRTLSEA